MSEPCDKNGKLLKVGDLIKLDQEFGDPLLKVYRRKSLFSGRLIWYGVYQMPSEPFITLLDKLTERFVIVE